MLGFIILFFVVIVYYSVFLFSGDRRKYIMKAKWKSIDYPKVIKYWLGFQLFAILCSINNKMMDWYDIISFPLLIITLCISHAILNIHNDSVYANDYDSKTEERDRKLDKLLKRRWL